MSPAAATTTAHRLVSTALALVGGTSLLGAAGSLVTTGTGPPWWALPLLGAVAASSGLCVRAAVQGRDPAPPALALLVSTVAPLATAPLLVQAGPAAAAAWPGGAAPGWPGALVVAAVAACAVLVRGWSTWSAVLALCALAVALTALGGLQPAAGPADVHPLVGTAFLAGLAVAVHSAVRGVEDVSGRVRTARAAAARADEEAEELAIAEAERSRWEAAVHDDVLSALRAAGAADTQERAKEAAAAASASLEGLAAGPSTLVVSTAAVAQLVGTAARGAREGTEVDLDVAPGSLPGRVAEALADATAELLRNTRRHNAGSVRSRVGGRVAGEGVLLVVSDDGAGFDPGAVEAGRLGLRVSVVGRMRSVGGGAEVSSSPGGGTSVRLRWEP